MVTINWSAFLPDLALMVSAFAAGSVFGSWMAHRDYTRERELLRSLVPSPGLLRSLAYCADGVVPVYAEAARALAARIEEAGEWEE